MAVSPQKRGAGDRLGMVEVIGALKDKRLIINDNVLFLGIIWVLCSLLISPFGIGWIEWVVGFLQPPRKCYACIDVSAVQIAGV